MSAKAKSQKSQPEASHKKPALKAKQGLHPRNQHQGQYDFPALINTLPALKPFVIRNPSGEPSINFSDAMAVKMLNKALLAHHYHVTHWDIPAGYLCPPIPGRADYIHRVADLLLDECSAIKHEKVQALDIGIGANCIYPIVGVAEYGWRYVGSDIDPISIKSANLVVNGNASLNGRIECRLQSDAKHIFKQIIQENERYDLTTCNPPFHASQLQAQQGSERKLKNLQRNRVKKGQEIVGQDANRSKAVTLNFGGQKAELWCPGGEAAFIKNMAFESQHYAQQVLWFTTLISKKENVRWMQKQLDKVGAAVVKVVEMQQGQKVSRFIAWSFQNDSQRKQWLAAKC
ncbi:23S rRNA (adenine(1618)-N(6))-methyltransferase RlmF [Vibrio anguillarum]|uniref:23S rRNA (adenine(1618)-N(6))-methyltransferase RlmF n=1 Tax=Vibrio anguillarum TaxID=55601 RepID=UPI00188C51B5|nr:23S rRNA (adenine(1618)-N(6))-methyltransferase RlmF [Vibrio anguillarum]MBF4256933.1 23S rRNA (adenine(1618)-N(6))-methyltransferase RlmF [Vibrio anguillarum]MBF4278316.1 23S rRNA (adenine(1618)-N(6))-methyltransferase RlmF [Vibrio anguillarum]MBF4298699.1 23S rRNA (adenine(1618)-N(6))-methyltransferase RlmF [Vibrio anguillarum]MBF4362754.1 23S rRNA (adenine(1618)-N(6))-methyltransferase RlmF [Vibrio anguillarum]MBF4396767.1 23S rRNA (adenine(1618)-N(6))-methyltransferase RlmF [Vibrio angu